jgi:hypothetical protein
MIVKAVKSKVLALIAIALAALAQTNAVAQCHDVPHGNFDAGFAGWIAEPLIRQTGQAFADASANVVDGTPFGPPLVGHAAMLSTLAYALGDESGGAHQASASMTLSTIVIVTDRLLSFEGLGGWEAMRNGASAGSYALRAEVIGDKGASASRTFLSAGPFPPLPECAGMSILGLIASEGAFTLDVLFNGDTPTGIHLNDKVTVRVTIECSAAATSACDEMEFGATVLVDEFHFCPALGCEADTNGDDAVNADDLTAVILNWGACPTPPETCLSDVDNDGEVDVDDLIAVVLGWGECR